MAAIFVSKRKLPLSRENEVIVAMVFFGVLTVLLGFQ